MVGIDSPYEEEFPAPQREQAVASLRWLAGDGALVMRLHRWAGGWRPNTTKADCERIADQLDRLVPPDEVFWLIAGIEDETLQELLHAEQMALGTAITAGANGHPATPEPDGFTMAELRTLIDKRLAELRIAAR